jgi:DNA-binding NarL/FixJ family response regulator
MSRDILVTVIGDDVFARDWMSLLLVRDWRTRVVSEITSKDDFNAFKQDGIQKVDFLLVDLDSIVDQPALINHILEDDAILEPAKLLLVGSICNPKAFKSIPQNLFAGYLLKDEISSSLAWAITFAAEGSTVFTPSTLDLAYSLNYLVPKNKLILKSRNIPGLTDRQTDIAKLAIIFSIGRRDLADELKISDQWSYGMVSELYTKLGLSEVFDGSVDAYRYMEKDEVIKAHIKEILEDLGTSKKARDVETLAFHLLTMPAIEY